ncbi:MAG TPA: hypothetical protein VGZ02_17100 [Candidatus Baltobacteraceae bacterium]|nr:hypothetical protein [Candidatus Baltobacteraceae bacterium]
MVDLIAAVLGRPNALDAEVNALTAHALLTAPPTALIDPARAAAAARLQDFRNPMWIATLAVQIVALAWFWSTGRSAHLRDLLRARMRSEFWVRFCFGAALALIDRAASFIPQAIQYRFMKLMDLNELLFRTWLGHWIAGTIVIMIVVGLTAAIVLGLADRTHQWYVYTIAGVLAFTLLVAYVTPVLITPLTGSLVPFHPSAASQRPIAQIEQRTQSAIPIVVEQVSNRTRSGRAYVLGWGGTQRMVISDTLVAGSTPAEMQFFVARSLVWMRANLGLQTALVQAAFIVVGAALSVLIADRIGFRRDDDPVSRLALLGAVIGCVYAVALPFYNGYARRADIVVESAAVGVTADPVAAIRSEVRAADQDLDEICPKRVTYWYLSERAPVDQRIANLQNRPDECATRRR